MKGNKNAFYTDKNGINFLMKKIHFNTDVGFEFGISFFRLNLDFFLNRLGMNFIDFLIFSHL